MRVMIGIRHTQLGTIEDGVDGALHLTGDVEAMHALLCEIADADDPNLWPGGAREFVRYVLERAGNGYVWVMPAFN